jgi:hypothetical protein
LIARCSSARTVARIGSGREVSPALAISGWSCVCWASNLSNSGGAAGARLRRVGHSQRSSSACWWCSTLSVTAICSSIAAWCPTSRGWRAASASCAQPDHGGDLRRSTRWRELYHPHGTDVPSGPGTLILDVHNAIQATTPEGASETTSKRYSTNSAYTADADSSRAFSASACRRPFL